MKSIQCNPRTPAVLMALAILAAAGTARQGVAANVTWSGAGPDLNWSDAANWTGGTPSGNAVIFPSLAFPGSTNINGAINSIVDSSVAITGLTYANTNTGAVLFFDTTEIGTNQTLTVNGTVSIGVNNATVTAGMAGSNCTFLVSNTAGNFNLEGNSATAQTVTFTLGDGTNIIDVGTFSMGETGGNNGRQATLNLGNGTNVINANTIHMGTGKGAATIQFAGPSGGLTIRNAAGTGRASLLMGNGTSGSGAAKGTLSLAGHPANILASTLIMGELGDDSGNQSGFITFDHGVLDVTTIIMAEIPATGNLSTGNANGSTLTVGGDPLNTATLVVNSPSGPGGGGFILSDCITNISHTGSGTLSIQANGSAQIYCSIVKTQAIQNTATITISGGTLIMEAPTDTVGTPAAPIDTVNLTSGTLVLGVANNQTNISSSSLNLFDANSTVNITSLPIFAGYPSQFPLISYTFNGSGGIINLGTLPGTFMGYISNDNVSTFWLVVTNGPSTAKADEWGGGANDQWNTSSLNWTNLGVAVAYAENDSVTFDDLAQTGIVDLTGPHTPLGLLITNNTLNYNFNGIGSIGGTTGLRKEGRASLILSETGGDNFNGGVVVNGGTLVFDDAASSISGGLTIASGATAQIGNGDASGTLPAGAVEDDGALAFDSTASLTLATPIAGVGTLAQAGSGKLTVTSANAYTGATTVTAGTLALSGTGTISNSASLAVTSGTLDVSGVTGTALFSAVDVTNSTIDVGVPYAQTPIIVASLSAGGTANTINAASLPPTAGFPVTITLIQSASPINGFNFTLGTVPSATPAYAGFITNSSDNMAVVLTLTAGPTGARPFVEWSGSDAIGNVNTNWTDSANWLLPGVPGSADSVVFTVTAAQTASALSSVGGGPSALNAAAVNNIVNEDFTISSLTYTNANGSYHNTLIPDDVTLSVTNAGGLTVGSGSADLGSGVTEFATIAGPNGTLNVANTNASVYVALGDSSSANEMATLDLSALGTFNATVKQFLVGVGSSSLAIGIGRPGGTVYLAATNTIKATIAVSGTETSDAGANAVAIDIGDADGNGGLNALLYLGQTNAIFGDAVVTGRQKQKAGIFFNPAFANPSAYFRGQDGVSPISVWGIGDGVANSGTATCTGTNDFTGGHVDILATTLYVGRSADNTSGSGTASGYLTLDDGTINVGSVVAGNQTASSSKNAFGSINVNTNAIRGTSGTLSVSGDLSLGVSTGGTGATISGGELNINGGTVELFGIVGPSGGGTNLVNLNGGTLAILSTAGTPSTPVTTLNLGGGTLQLDVAGNIIVTNIVATTVNATAATTIQLGALMLINSGVTYPLISYTGIDPYSSLTLGPLPAGYTGGLVDDSADGIVGITFTNVVSTPRPVITGIDVEGGQVVINGANGTAGYYYVLTSTNLATPLSNWTRLATNTLSASGNFSFTTPVNANSAQQFYTLELP